MLHHLDDETQAILFAAAKEAQAFYLAEHGEEYDIHDLVKAFSNWFRASAEELANDAMTLCVTGDRTHAAFNRSAFEREMKRIKPIAVAE